MAPHAPTFLLVTVLVLLTVLLVFGMKYFASARQARLVADDEDTYRDLAGKAAAAQSALAASIETVQADLSEIKTRLATIEKVLSEVQ
jgi:Tfp pilus assembly protein PilO